MAEIRQEILHVCGGAGKSGFNRGEARVGRRHAGRRLDGAEHDGMPQPLTRSAA